MESKVLVLRYNHISRFSCFFLIQAAYPSPGHTQHFERTYVCIFQYYIFQVSTSRHAYREGWKFGKGGNRKQFRWVKNLT